MKKHYESSVIAGSDYNRSTKRLTVALLGGPELSLYEYSNVPAEVAEGLATAESAGRFFTRNIRSNFPFIRIH
jgi:hypothetical protein